MKFRSTTAQERFHDHTLAIMQSALPTPITNAIGCAHMPEEITQRIMANALIVNKSALRDQILIIFADYRNHSWTGKVLNSESKRLQLADLIMKGLK